MEVNSLKEIEDNKIGWFIKKTRQDKGLSQPQLAKMIGKSAKSISRFEIDSSAMTLKIFCDIIKALDGTVNISVNA